MSLFRPPRFHENMTARQNFRWSVTSSAEPRIFRCLKLNTAHIFHMHARTNERTNLKRQLVQPNHLSIFFFFFYITNIASNFENFEKEKFQCKAYFDILNANFPIFIICTVFDTTILLFCKLIGDVIQDLKLLNQEIMFERLVI